MLSAVDVDAIMLLMIAVIAFVNEVYLGMPRGIALLLGALVISLLFMGADVLVPLNLIGRLRLRLEHANLPHLLLDGALAFLLFAASLHVNLEQLRSNARLILVLATASVILATAIFGGAIWGAAHAVGLLIPLGWCLVLGAVLAPTDAVIVDALLRPLPLPPALKAAVSGESLFNDGAGVVLFVIMLSVAQGQHGLIGHGRIALALLTEVVGGAALGAAFGWIASWAMRRADEPAVCLLISLALVLATYRLAGALGISGPIAVAAAGLAVGRAVPAFTLAARGHDERPSELIAFWSLVDQVLNALLFLLMGFEVLALDPSRVPLLPILLALPLALLSRLVSVAIPVLAIRGGRATARGMALLTWAGLRGGVSVALALSLPPSPWRPELLAICYGVVLFTVVVQGLTMPQVVRALYGGGEPVAAVAGSERTGGGA